MDDEIDRSFLKPGYVSDFSPHEWVLPNYTEFPEWVNETFKDRNMNKKRVEAEAQQTCTLYPHQRFLRNFIGSHDSPYRGVLLYHGLGTGKTITSISIAESLSSNRKIVVMLPASLVRNYVNEIISCGNDAFNRIKHWIFYPSSHIDFMIMKSRMQNFGVDPKIIKKNNGVWAFDDAVQTKTTNYDLLDENSRGQINMQIESMIKKRYTFIHYNGLSRSKLRAMGPKPFENKTVIIDEVHNFISGVKNKRFIRMVLYEMLMETNDVKVIGLSGTPIINEPCEISYLANLIHGPMEVFQIQFLANRFFNQNIQQIQNYLEKHKLIDYFEILERRASIILKFVPPGFERVSEMSNKVKKSPPPHSGGLSRSRRATLSTMLEEVSKELIDNFHITEKNRSSFKHLLLPEEKEAFDEYFLTPNGELRNRVTLMRRLQGIISYFASNDVSEFPRVSKMHIIRPEMPVKVFEKYQIVREKERKQEIDSRKRQRNDDESASLNVYKAFSRALCLFRFPDSIPREYPSDMKKAASQELDFTGDGDDHENNAFGEGIEGGDEEEMLKREKNKRKALKSDYKQSKESAMQKLRENADKYLMGSALKTYGIKYYEALKRIQASKGSVVIYSHFREVEGIGIMKEVLNAHGYFELDIENRREVGWTLQLPVEKERWMSNFYIVFTNDKAKNKMLMDIFNSETDFLPLNVRDQIKKVVAYRKQRGVDTPHFRDFNLRGEFIKAMMITQSGSEGISLKNVRQVHILEPYWNPIRIKQVIGRAARVKSHARLPYEDRVVDVFMYIMSLGKNLLPADKNLSSDETIENIAKRKDIQIEGVQTLLQKTAFDCRLNAKLHPHVGKCFKLQKSFGKYAYAYGGLEDDPSDVNMFMEREKIENKEDEIKRKKTTTTTTTRNTQSVRGFENENENEESGHAPKVKVTQTKKGKLYYIPATQEIIDPKLFEADKTRKSIGHIVNEKGVKKIRYFS